MKQAPFSKHYLTLKDETMKALMHFEECILLCFGRNYVLGPVDLYDGYVERENGQIIGFECADVDMLADGTLTLNAK